MPPAGPTGPRTPEGKSRCRLNAYRHGLTGQVLVFTPEEHTAYDRHCSELKSHYRPIGAVEEKLVQAVADSQWRLQRAASLENSVFAMAFAADDARPAADHPEVEAAFAHAAAWLAESRNLALLSLYEQRIARRLEKDLAALRAEQQRRLSEYDEAMATAKRLFKAAKSQGETYKPEAYFRGCPEAFESVFSESHVAHEIAREKLDTASRGIHIAELPDNFRHRRRA